MSSRNYLIVSMFFGVATFASVIGVATPLFAQTGRSTGSVVVPLRVVDAESPLVRGQEEVGRKPPSLADRFKKILTNLTREKDGESPDATARERDLSRESNQRSQAIPVAPPKPPTPHDVREAVNSQDVVVEKRTPPPGPSALKVADPPAPAPRRHQDAEVGGSPNTSSLHQRLEEIRNEVFTVEQRTKATPPVPPPIASPVPPPLQPEKPQDVAPRPRPTLSDVFPDRPVSPTLVQETVNDGEKNPSTVRNFTQIAMGNKAIEPEVDPLPPPKSSQNSLSAIYVPPKSPDPLWTSNPHSRPMGSQQGSTAEMQDPSTNPRLEIGPQERTTTGFAVDREKITGPMIELETIAASKAIVGQEAAYQIRVINRGGAPAERVVLTVEVPNWIDMLQPDISAGTTSITSREPNSDIQEFVWKIAKVDAKTEEQIVLHLIPRQPKTVDLKIRYDFHKPQVAAKFVVLQPIIEMELQGPREVMWGSKVSYKLIVRNSGNGDAENIKLELLQTGSDMKSCELPLLEAGKEQVIDVDVWTGKQEHVDINIQATGPYDLTATAVKRVLVLRPELSIHVEAPEMLFVGNPAEYTVRVQNTGNAPAKNVELAATIPLGTRYISNTAGGRPTPQNQVLWNIDTIPSGGEFVATIVCEMKREGNCKLEVTANDKSGLQANGIGSVNVEAIADLKMQLENPQGPVEVGQEAVFVISITNRGTKTAEDVEVIAAFARGLEPFAVEGANGTMSDGQVIFDKIPTISAGQTVTLKVKGKADRPGNHRIRAELICQGINAHLVNEQQATFFQKQRNTTSFMVDSPGADGVSDQPATPHSLQKSTASQPLQEEAATAERPTLAPLR